MFSLTATGDLASLDQDTTPRGTIRAWLARFSALDASQPVMIDRFGLGYDVRAEGRDDAPRVASAFEHKVRSMRANAHAAFRSVEGAHRVEAPDAAALDAALDVIEAAWKVAVADRDSYAEALKTIRLYAPDERSRTVATDCLRGTGDCARARAASSGYRRYPFTDELDG